MSSILDFSVKAANKKQKPLGLSSTLHNVDLQLLNQYVNMFTICFHGQTVTKISLRHGIVKVLMQDYWFRLNQPVSTMVLETETRQPGEFILRLLRKGVEQGRYIQSEAEYLPSFTLANELACRLQAVAIPFRLQSSPFLINTESPNQRFISDFCFLVGDHAPAVNLAGALVLLWLVAFEITHAGPVTATILAEKTGLSKSTISNILDRFISAGYLTRQLDPLDERSRLLSLTPSDDYRAGLQVLLERYFSL